MKKAENKKPCNCKKKNLNNNNNNNIKFRKTSINKLKGKMLI